LTTDEVLKPGLTSQQMLFEFCYEVPEGDLNPLGWKPDAERIEETN